MEMNNDKHAYHHQLVTEDVLAVVEFRKELGLMARLGPKDPASITGTPDPARFNKWLNDRGTAAAQVVQSKNIFRVRVDTLYWPNASSTNSPERTAIYFSRHGRLPNVTIAMVEDKDAYLISWSHDVFGKMLKMRIGQRLKLPTQGTYEIVGRSVVGSEEFCVLNHIASRLKASLRRFFRASPEGVIDLSEANTWDDSIELDDPEQNQSADGIQNILSPDAAVTAKETSKPDDRRIGLNVLDEHVRGIGHEIVLSLDADQENALRRYAGSGIIKIIGPPGTGKTTIALMRSRALLATLINDDGRVKDGSPALSKDRFVIFVVTRHLEYYFKNFLSSDELGMNGVQIHNIRDGFFEVLFRDELLRKWKGPLRTRLGGRKPVSDQLKYLKSHSITLKLIPFAIRSTAIESFGPEGENFREGFESSLSDKHRSEQDSNKSRIIRETEYFIKFWMGRLDDLMETDPNDWMNSKFNTLLLTDQPDPKSSQKSPTRDFGDSIFNYLHSRLHPQDILLHIIQRLRLVPPSQLGMSETELEQALLEWAETINTAKGNDGLSTETKDPNDLTALLQEGANNIPDEGENDGLEEKSGRRSGIITESDLPLLACIARLLLARRVKDRKHGRRGFLLPDRSARFDHVIIDEAQDLSAAEILFACSMVEPELAAVSLAGDSFQRMDWRSGSHSLELINLDNENRTFTVRRNYRQTATIKKFIDDLAQCLYPNETIPTILGRGSGPKPRFRALKGARPTVIEMARLLRGWFRREEEPFVTILTIGVERERQQQIAEILSNQLDGINVIHAVDGNAIVRGKVSVAEVPTVKGLEFDAVIVYIGEDAVDDLDMINARTRHLRNQLYVACTRARKRLEVFYENRTANVTNSICTAEDR